MSFLDELHKALAEEEKLTPDIVCELIASQFGSRQVYITKEFRRGEVTRLDTVQTLVRRGVPRRTAYNWVNKWK